MEYFGRDPVDSAGSGRVSPPPGADAGGSPGRGQGHQGGFPWAWANENERVAPTSCEKHRHMPPHPNFFTIEITTESRMGAAPRERPSSCFGSAAPTGLGVMGESIEDTLFRTRSQAMARERMRDLLHRFAERAARTKEQMLASSPSPQSCPEPGEAQWGTSAAGPAQANTNAQTFDLKKRVDFNLAMAAKPKKTSCYRWWDFDNCDKVFDPQGTFYVTWLFMVSLCFCYNAVAIPLRFAFRYQTDSNTRVWLSFDCLCDIIYLIDVAIVKPRVSYLYDGLWVVDPKQTKTNYFSKYQFKLDLVSLFPVEVLYMYFGTGAVLLRLPRLMKFQTFFSFSAYVDKIISSPFSARIGRSLMYMFYLIHLNTCMYYKVSVIKGLGSNGWVYNGVGNNYLRCFYFALKCATSIGKNPKPETEFEFMYMTCSWLMGVFIFALLIGQVRDIIATATRQQNEYRKLVDETSQYMRQLNLPSDLQHRVNTWFRFTWDQQHTLDETQIINELPINMKTDVAINVHIQTLSKVQLFNDCDEAVLRDLVLKLRSVIYLPGDFICRKGEVGKEMYIVKMGEVQVMGGEKETEVLATLSEGSVFGEISLLAIDGGNRRTADVKSKGFSNLFVLSKDDLNATLAHYPEAEKKMLEKAKNIMRKNKEETKKKTEPEIIIQNPASPEKPSKFLQTILEVIPENSGAGQLLRRGSRASAKRKEAKRYMGSPNFPVTNKGRDAAMLDDSKCYCDRLRRKTLPKTLRRKKVPLAGQQKNLFETGLYDKRNCSSEINLDKHVCDSGEGSSSKAC